MEKLNGKLFAATLVVALMSTGSFALQDEKDWRQAYRSSPTAKILDEVSGSVDLSGDTFKLGGASRSSAQAQRSNTLWTKLEAIVYAPISWLKSIFAR